MNGQKYMNLVSYCKIQGCKRTERFASHLRAAQIQGSKRTEQFVNHSRAAQSNTHFKFEFDRIRVELEQFVNLNESISPLGQILNSNSNLTEFELLASILIFYVEARRAFRTLYIFYFFIYLYYIY